MWEYIFKCNKCEFKMNVTDIYILKHFGYCPNCGGKAKNNILKQELYKGCNDCKFSKKSENEEPCKSCTHNFVDRFEFIEK